MAVQKAQWWAEDIPSLDAVRRGLLVPRKFYTDAPIGLSGLAINLTRPPLDDVRIGRPSTGCSIGRESSRSCSSTNTRR